MEGTNRKGDKSAYTYNGLFVRVNNTQTTHAGQVYDRDFVIDYLSFERNDLMVFSPDYYQQKHAYTTWGERMEMFTDRTAQSDGNGGLIRLLYVHEDIMGNTRYCTKDNGQSFAELEYDVWGAPTSPSKLVNKDNGNFAAKSSAEFGRTWKCYLWILGCGAWISSGYSIFWWRDDKNY